MAKAKHRATYDDLRRLPANLVGEILDGELVATPRPAAPHAHTATQMTSDLVGAFGRPPGGGRGGIGGWHILFEPELHFGGDVLVPDIAGWRRERMPKIPNAPAIELSPDWVCEITSQSTARIDRVGKAAIYARVKVRHLWMVDPLAQTLEVFRLESGGWLKIAAHAADERVRAEPFDAVELALGLWWGETESGT